jgi:undecaprenyl diphosphate synthase
MFPQHIAIIPDGNRRWGKQQGIGANIGHEKGAENFREISRAAFGHGVPWITFWAASEDNLAKRSRAEVSFLAHLLSREISSAAFLNEMEENQISVRFIGTWDTILRNAKLNRAINTIQEKTAGFKKFHLTILFGYDGRTEMLEAVKKMMRETAKKIDRGSFARALWTGTLPSVDLVIRTGEEDAGWCHWSAGFMMWQAAQSEFYTTKTLWPDFSRPELERVFKEYSRRERRFGK